MNCIKAKQIKIEDFLKSINIYPDSSRHSRAVLKYKAPYRNETTASLEVNTNKNIWYDYGAGIGGNIIDLVMQIQNTDFQGSLEFLESKNIQSFSFCKQNKIKTEKRLIILSTGKIKSPALIQYLENRKISFKIASIYLLEVYYKIIDKEKKYYAIGFENIKGGMELRNKYFKSCSSPKYYSFIPGYSNNKLNIFEGFFDFLSALEYNKTTKLKFDTLVLNSVANKNKTTELINKYKGLNLFLDNDPSGENAFQYFKSIHNNITDYSKDIYPGYNDFNEFLKNNIEK